MDPNANLAEQRALLRTYRTRGHLTKSQSERLVELVDALDAWIANGGFLPDAWKR